MGEHWATTYAQDEPVYNEKAVGRPEEDITELAPQANDETQITDQMREKVVDICARMQKERWAKYSGFICPRPRRRIHSRQDSPP